MSSHEPWAQDLPAADTGVRGVAHATPRVTIVLEQAVEREGGMLLESIQPCSLNADPLHGPASATPPSRLEFPSECEQRLTLEHRPFLGELASYTVRTPRQAEHWSLTPGRQAGMRDTLVLCLEGSPCESVTGAWLRNSMPLGYPGLPRECCADGMAGRV